MCQQDKTFDFERKRNRPVKYDRELYQTTLAAMTRVQEIKEKREAKFYKVRCAHQLDKFCSGRRLATLNTFCLMHLMRTNKPNRRIALFQDAIGQDKAQGGEVEGAQAEHRSSQARGNPCQGEGQTSTDGEDGGRKLTEDVLNFRSSIVPAGTTAPHALSAVARSGNLPFPEPNASPLLMRLSRVPPRLSGRCGCVRQQAARPRSASHAGSAQGALRVR